MLQRLLRKRDKSTGIECHYCGWHGQKEDLHSSKVLNTDGTPYTIQVCPQCMRNGGLTFHDDAPK